MLTDFVMLDPTDMRHRDRRFQEEASFEPAGYVAPAPAALLNRAATWQAVSDTEAVHAIELRSLNAAALRVQFEGVLPADVELRVYDPVTANAFGPVEFLPPDEQGRWWSTIIFGDTIGLEFFATNVAAQRTALPRVVAIAHIAEVPLPIERECALRDVSCYSEYASEANAVAMAVTVSGGGNVVGFCSAALLNRVPGDLAPLVMTANHCLGSQSAANSAAYVWFFQTESCDFNVPNPNDLPRSNGSLMLKRHVSSDWNLVGLYEPPAANYYLGWQAGNWSDGDDAVGIHHPAGTFKKISIGSKTGASTGTFCDGNGNCFSADVWNINYTVGTTQGGSSGSPVMDGNDRVRGTLTGGPSACELRRYGRFDLAFENLRYFLGSDVPIGTVYVDGDVAGDPGNNGNTERGSAANPFNSVYEATFAVRASNAVAITPGTYNERFVLRRPLLLRRDGGSGTVLIGQ